MVFKCKMCDASLNIQEGDKITTCEYCGTTQTVPQFSDERIANLYNRDIKFQSVYISLQ